ncbi:MAG: 2-phosphosulfolactate phosphatase [Planctomycetaceae bacterium]
MNGPRVRICHVGDDAPLPVADTYVVVDVIRASTTAVTAAHQGRGCHPVRSIEEAHRVAASLPTALLAGELHGTLPEGFDLQNSPAALDGRVDVNRPLVLLSTSGAPLMRRAAEEAPTLIVSLRNLEPTADVLRAVDRVAILAASPDGLRIEDAICAARLARSLGGEPDEVTARIVETCAPLPLEKIRAGKSAAYLRRSDQVADLEFVLQHVGDVDAAFAVVGGRVAALATETRA